jgi:hypothetical protein
MFCGRLPEEDGFGDWVGGEGFCEEIRLSGSEETVERVPEDVPSGAEGNEGSDGKRSVRVLNWRTWSPEGRVWT